MSDEPLILGVTELVDLRAVDELLAKHHDSLMWLRVLMRWNAKHPHRDVIVRGVPAEQIDKLVVALAEHCAEVEFKK